MGAIVDDLGDGGRGDSNRKLLSKLNYREPLDLMPRFACMLGSSGIENCNTDALAFAGDAINEERQHMRQRTAFQDEWHPAVIVHTIMSRTKGHQ